MQTVMLSTWGGRGDVEPLVALAERLLSIGSQVRVCAPPDDDFIRRFRAIGLGITPVGPGTRELTQAKPGTASIPDTAKRIVREQFQALPAIARTCDLVVATGALPAAAGALSVAELVGTPAVSVTFQQLTIPSPTRRPLAYPGHPLPQGETDPARLWAHDAAAIEAFFGDAVRTPRAAHGLPARPVRDLVVTDQPWVATDPVLDRWDGTPGLDAVQTGAWSTADATPLSPELLAFLDAGPPPVYVGFGSMPMHAEGLVGDVLNAARAVRRRVVLMRGWAVLPESDGADDLFVTDSVNHQALFPRCAAVVHHGGAGTTFAATRSGTPQVVVPQIADQPYWAQRVADLGVGVAHDGSNVTAASLRTALDAVLTPEMRSRATSIAGTIRPDGATVAARLLVER